MVGPGLAPSLDRRSTPSTSDPSGPAAFYSVSQAAALLGISRVTIWRWIRDGRLPVVRLGRRTIRISRDDLDRTLLQRMPPVRSGARSDYAEPAASPRHWSGHIVQFYEADATLVDGAADFLGTGLRSGDVVVVIATAEHCEGLEARFRADGLAVEAARAAGRYFALDANETLARFMVDGQPDPARFVEVIGGLIARATADGRPVRAFGEMVALLATEGNQAAAVGLEALWNELQQKQAFTLLCAYPIERLGGPACAELVDDVCLQHTRVIPAESYSGLADPNAQLREIARLQQKAAALEAEVAERKRAEERVWQSERELRDFVENATEGLHWVGPDGRILWANRAELELLGYAADEYIGHAISEFHADPEVIADILRRLSQDEALQSYEARLRARDGSIKDVLINSNVYREHGRFVHTRCFTRDITARKQAERDREALLEREQAARAEAEAALRLRDEFVAIAAHELRTPLTTLSAHAQLALRRLQRAGDLDPERIATVLQTIGSQSGKLAGLLNQLLDISRLQGGKLVIERQPTNLAVLVEQTVAGARLRSAEHVISFEVPAALEAQIDSARLEQVLTNLLDNAIKYSPDGGPIEVSLSQLDGAVIELAVRDHGLGIPPERRAQIFERFYQAHADGHRSGMGLGLYISRQIVEQHGGQIRAEFPPDGGSRFLVHLPSELAARGRD